MNRKFKTHKLLLNIKEKYLFQTSGSLAVNAILKKEIDEC